MKCELLTEENLTLMPDFRVRYNVSDSRNAFSVMCRTVLVE